VTLFIEFNGFSQVIFGVLIAVTRGHTEEFKAPVKEPFMTGTNPLSRSAQVSNVNGVGGN
jgi:hypothetical protein